MIGGNIYKDENKDSKGYYETLGVNKNSTSDEIKSAYKKKAVETHPDKNDGRDNGEFKKAAEAYVVLSDNGKKSRYDNGEDVGQGAPKSDEQIAIMKLAMLFELMIESGKFNLSYDNIFAKMKKDLKDTLKQLKQALPVLGKEKAQWKKIPKRIKSDIPVFLNVINGKIEDIEAQIETVHKDIKVLLIMLDKLKNSDWLVDEKEEEKKQVRKVYIDLSKAARGDFFFVGINGQSPDGDAE